MQSEEQHELYGAWAERWPSDAADLLDGYSGHWWIGGGYAIDAAIGRERPHSDIDLVIPRSELSLLRGWLGSRWQFWCAFQGALKPLRTHDSDVLPIGTSSIWLRRNAYALWEYEVLLDPSDGDTWRFRRDTAVTLPLEDALDVHRGIRFAKPQVVLAYAATETDDVAWLEEALPALDADARAWLADRLADDHPWRKRLAAAVAE
ncbi:nucleotidyltransferase domain-containing protein [Agrococcus carbonis]|uniref:Aminoglycoside-2''-adenylyltransferase n=1 Tax=Agrococcus carbonis TaxID=684552 RepID=A0A1H1L2X1_9MICO|nr:hypothetical protein [Agrococcus carbonis]SDR68395.1 hypothetical protein SAMN04489719_0364 [Agrococcus carbonis]